jgi:hypothetical protein
MLFPSSLVPRSTYSLHHVRRRDVCTGIVVHRASSAWVRLSASNTLLKRSCGAEVKSMCVLSAKEDIPEMAKKGAL